MVKHSLLQEGTQKTNLLPDRPKLKKPSQRASKTRKSERDEESSKASSARSVSWRRKPEKLEANHSQNEKGLRTYLYEILCCEKAYSSLAIYLLLAVFIAVFVYAVYKICSINFTSKSQNGRKPNPGNSTKNNGYGISISDTSHPNTTFRTPLPTFRTLNPFRKVAFTGKPIQAVQTSPYTNYQNNMIENPAGYNSYNYIAQPTQPSPIQKFFSYENVQQNQYLQGDKRYLIPSGPKFGNYMFPQGNDNSDGSGTMDRDWLRDLRLTLLKNRLRLTTGSSYPGTSYPTDNPYWKQWYLSEYKDKIEPNMLNNYLKTLDNNAMPSSNSLTTVSHDTKVVQAVHDDMNNSNSSDVLQNAQKHSQIQNSSSQAFQGIQTARKYSQIQNSSVPTLKGSRIAQKYIPIQNTSTAAAVNASDSTRTQLISSSLFSNAAIKYLIANITAYFSSKRRNNPSSPASFRNSSVTKNNTGNRTTTPTYPTITTSHSIVSTTIFTTNPTRQSTAATKVPTFVNSNSQANFRGTVSATKKDTVTNGKIERHHSKSSKKSGKRTSSSKDKHSSHDKPHHHHHHHNHHQHRQHQHNYHNNNNNNNNNWRIKRKKQAVTVFDPEHLDDGGEVSGSSAEFSGESGSGSDDLSLGPQLEERPETMKGNSHHRQSHHQHYKVKRNKKKHQDNKKKRKKPRNDKTEKKEEPRDGRKEKKHKPVSKHRNKDKEKTKMPDKIHNEQHRDKHPSKEGSSKKPDHSKRKSLKSTHTTKHHKEKSGSHKRTLISATLKHNHQGMKILNRAQKKLQKLKEKQHRSFVLKHFSNLQRRLNKIREKTKKISRKMNHKKHQETKLPKTWHKNEIRVRKCTTLRKFSNEYSVNISTIRRNNRSKSIYKVTACFEKKLFGHRHSVSKSLMSCRDTFYRTLGYLKLQSPGDSKDENQILMVCRDLERLSSKRNYVKERVHSSYKKPRHRRNNENKHDSNDDDSSNYDDTKHDKRHRRRRSGKGKSKEKKEKSKKHYHEDEKLKRHHSHKHSKESVHDHKSAGRDRQRKRQHDKESRHSKNKKSERHGKHDKHKVSNTNEMEENESSRDKEEGKRKYKKSKHKNHKNESNANVDSEDSKKSTHRKGKRRNHVEDDDDEANDHDNEEEKKHKDHHKSLKKNKNKKRKHKNHKNAKEKKKSSHKLVNQSDIYANLFDMMKEMKQELQNVSKIATSNNNGIKFNNNNSKIIENSFMKQNKLTVNPSREIHSNSNDSKGLRNETTAVNRTSDGDNSTFVSKSVERLHAQRNKTSQSSNSTVISKSMEKSPSPLGFPESLDEMVSKIVPEVMKEFREREKLPTKPGGGTPSMKNTVRAKPSADNLGKSSVKKVETKKEVPSPTAKPAQIPKTTRTVIKPPTRHTMAKPTRRITTSKRKPTTGPDLALILKGLKALGLGTIHGAPTEKPVLQVRKATVHVNKPSVNQVLTKRADIPKPTSMLKPLPLHNPSQIHILCFGDSLTAGYYNHGKMFYPYGRRLNQLINFSSRLPAVVESQGVVGEMTHKQMVARLPQVLGNSSIFDWVIILGGTNDILHVKNFADDEEFLSQLENVWQPRITKDIEKLHTISQHYGAHTMVLTVPENAIESWPGYKLLQTMRSKINNALRDFAMRNQDRVAFCDIAKKLPRHTLTPEQEALYWDDHLHMTPQGYNRMADAVFDCLKPYLPR